MSAGESGKGAARLIALSAGLSLMAALGLMFAGVLPLFGSGGGGRVNPVFLALGAAFIALSSTQAAVAAAQAKKANGRAAPRDPK